MRSPLGHLDLQYNYSNESTLDDTSTIVSTDHTFNSSTLHSISPDISKCKTFLVKTNEKKKVSDFLFLSSLLPKIKKKTYAWMLFII
jgi:hypothetical protein